MGQAHRLAPTPLEIAAGFPLGDDPLAPPLPPVEPSLTPRRALEEAVLPALRRPPCLASFSGGRDSSAMLAVAVDVARREGLPLPVPVTVRFREAPGASEPEWQETVLAHLGLEDWLRIEVGDELDLVGPYARGILRRHGVVHPVNAPLFALMLERAEGGSLVTGTFGDPVLGGWLYWHPAAVLAGRELPRPRDIALAGYALAPARVKGRARRRRSPSPPWLRPGARRLVDRIQDESLARRPRSWRGHLAAQPRSRAHAACCWSLDLIAADAGALVSHPLGEPRFLGALARAGGSRGLGSRTAIMRVLFADLLPEPLLSRATKARFSYAYFRAPSREFARRFGGEGLDEGLVDPEALRAAWLSLMPNGASALSLQAAWLAYDSAGRELEHPVADLG